jgi:hypothetical protein
MKIELDDLVKDLELDLTNPKDVLDQIIDQINKKLDLIPSYTEDEEDETQSVTVGSVDMSDDEVYKKILQGIGAPITDENMKFFYAWRQSEGAHARYNPFNTTQPKDGSSFYNCLKRKNGKCSGGVRNYPSLQVGIDATIKTLLNGHYDCIVDQLRNNESCTKHCTARYIARHCRKDLKTWGTGDLVGKVLDGKTLNPPEIETDLVKTVT